MPPPQILFSDDTMLVVDKPPGLPVTPAGAGGAGGGATLSGLVRERLDGEAKPAHRIDAEAGGPVVFARTKPALDFLSGQFQSKTVEMVWTVIAVVQAAEEAARPTRVVRDGAGGVPDEFTLDWPLVEDASAPARWRVGRRQEGRAASTVVRCVERFGRFALLECVAPPAPPHQVRVHLATAGLPALNDAVYGAAGVELRLSDLKRGYKGRAEERPLINGLAVHATRLTVRHATTREPLTVESAWPKDFAVAVKNLRKFKRPAAAV